MLAGAEDVHLAVRAPTEREESLEPAGVAVGQREHVGGPGPAVGRRRRDEQAAVGPEVAEHVPARQRRQRGAAVHLAADDGNATDRRVRAGVLDDGVGQRFAAAHVAGRSVGAVRRPVAVGALPDVPAVVAARLDEVDLLEAVLADVADEQPPVVEGQPVGVPEAPRVLFVEARAADERVVPGDGVAAVAAAVDVDAEDAAQEVLRDVLAVAPGDGVVPVVDVALALVVAGTAVTDRDVEVAVGSA